MQDSSMLLELARVVLPEEFVDNFKIVGINRLSKSVEFEMECPALTLITAVTTR